MASNERAVRSGWLDMVGAAVDHLDGASDKIFADFTASKKLVSARKGISA
jgi:hypothetical protein